MVDDGGNLKIWMTLPFAAYLCGNVLFANRLGDMLWPVCEEYIVNFDFESSCS